MRWWSTLYISRSTYTIHTLDWFALDSRYLYWEQQGLIEALEGWLGGKNEQTTADGIR